MMAGRARDSSRAVAGEGGMASRPGRMGLFLRSALPDFLLVLVASTALVFTVSYGFESAPELRADVGACAGLAAPLLLVLFAGSYSKRAMLPAAAGAVLYAVAVLAFFGSQVPEGVEVVAGGRVNDVAENPVVFALVALVVPAAAYFLSRRRAGVVALLVACAVACGSVQFLYRDWSTAQPGTLAAFVAMAACGSLFIFQAYRSAAYSSRSVSKTAFGAAAGFAVLLSAACAVLGGAIFFGLIDPLGVSTPTVKPFEDYYQKPVLEYRSLYEEQEVENPDVLTNMTNDETRESNRDAQGGVEGETSVDQQDWSGSPLSSLIRNTLAFDPESWSETFNAISYQALALGLLAVLAALALLAVLAVAWQRARRARRLEKLRGQPRDVGVWTLYQFISKRLERLGFAKPESFTPLEFAMASRGVLAPFTRGTGGVDFLQLTLIYQRACYAPETLTAQDEADIVRYYRAFFGNARAYVGRRRWIWKSWWI